jgi:hypothetical protein
MFKSNKHDMPDDTAKDLVFSDFVLSVTAKHAPPWAILAEDAMDPHAYKNRNDMTLVTYPINAINARYDCQRGLNALSSHWVGVLKIYADKESTKRGAKIWVTAKTVAAEKPRRICRFPKAQALISPAMRHHTLLVSSVIMFALPI